MSERRIKKDKEKGSLNGDNISYTNNFTLTKNSRNEIKNNKIHSFNTPGRFSGSMNWK